LGGRWSDRTLARLKAENGGVSFPEVRIGPLTLAQHVADTIHADAPREHENRHVVGTSTLDWIRLGVSRTS
jgi:hypothetical protein